METLFEWMQSDSIPDKMTYKPAAKSQAAFFFLQIAPLFLRKGTTYEDRLKFVKICSWHKSKSILLPVYYFETPQIKVVARDNFYDWNATIITSVDLEIPDYFQIDSERDYLFFQGMESWKRGTHAENANEFSFCVRGEYVFFAIMHYIAHKVRTYAVVN